MNTQRVLLLIQSVDGHHSALGVSMCDSTDHFMFAWSLASKISFWSTVLEWIEHLDIDDIFLALHGDSGPLQLAGLCGVCSDLQRQIRLPVVHILTNVSTLMSWSLAECAPHIPEFCAYVHWVPLLGSILMTSVEHNAVPSGDNWVHRIQVVLEQLFEDCVLRILELLHTLLSTLSFWTSAVFRSGCLIMLSYLGRLLFFGLQLKGGRCNCDNLLQVGRRATEPAPWHLGVGLCSFSPRLQTKPAPRRQRSRLPPAYTAELYFFLLLLATVVQPGAAANYRRPPPHPAEFPRPPAYQDAAGEERGLLADGNVAQDIHPHIGAAHPPPEVFVTRAYKLLGFGRQPEYISCTTARTATAQRCLELLEPDVAVGRTGGQGALHFLRGPPVTDELHAHWIPGWVHSALGRVVVIDAFFAWLHSFFRMVSLPISESIDSSPSWRARSFTYSSHPRVAILWLLRATSHA